MTWMTPGIHDYNHQGWYDNHPVLAVSITIITTKFAVWFLWYLRVCVDLCWTWLVIPESLKFLVIYLQFNLIMLWKIAEFYHHSWRICNYVWIECVSTGISPVVVDTKILSLEKRVPVFMRFNRQCYFLGHPEVQAPNAVLLSKRIDSNPYLILQTNSVGVFT